MECTVSAAPDEPAESATGFLADGGLAGRLIRGVAWGDSPLGDPARWPQPLRTLVAVMLASRQPMFIAWGVERIWFYNDAFTPILGHKHPSAMGRPAMEVWAEAREVIEPLFDSVFAGESVHARDFTVDLDRHGHIEPAVFDFSYTPVRDDDGRIGGLFGVCIETTERVRSDRMRAERAERQRRQFDQAPGFVTVMSGPEHVVDFVNDTHRRVFDSADWLGKPIRQAVPSIAGQGFFELLDEVYRSGRPHQAERAPVRFRRGPDAPEELHYLNFVYAPIFDDDGSVSGIFCDGYDVSATVRAEQELRRRTTHQILLAELAERIRDLDDPADVSFAAAELLGRALGVSRAGYGTIHMPSETIAIERDWNAPGIVSLAGVLHFRDYGSYIEDLKRGATVVVADAEADPRTAPTAAALRAISAMSFVNMPVTEQQEFVALLYLNHAEARNWSDDELALIREVADRTRLAVERRRAEQGLRELAASLEQQVAERTQERDRVWQHARDLLGVIGADGVIRAVNPAWTVVLGHAAADIVGRRFADLVVPDDAERLQNWFAPAGRAARVVGDIELRLQHRDGSPRWIAWHTSAEEAQLYAYGRDLTAHKQAAAELAQAQEALRQAHKMEAVGQLTGGIAHDFNNLLAAISTSLELIGRSVEAGKTDQLDRFLTTARGAARRAAALTHRLLAFSRRQTLDPRPTDGNQLVAGMEDLIRRSVGPDIAFEVRPAEGLWLTRIDPSQLENALLNLCINSRDAMAETGGRLSISTTNLELGPRDAQQAELAAGQYISIEVADSGPGIAPEIIDRIFDPFFTTKPLGEGTGLGLSMVYGFARQSGGQLRVQSTPGCGAAFSLILPRHRGEDDNARETTAATTARSEVGSGSTVLVIDDEADIRSLLLTVLQDAGYTTIEAADGAAALRVLQSDVRIDLLLTDVGLPGGINGRQVADAGRAMRPGLKVIFVTGYAEAAVLGSSGLGPGMALLTKPFEVPVLERRVRELIDGH